MFPNVEKSIPLAYGVLSTGDEFRTYVDPTDPGSYIVLRNTSVTLHCSASGDGVFSYSWSKVVDSVLQTLPMENTSVYRVPPLQSDQTYECRVWNPLITTRDQQSDATFSLRVVGKFYHLLWWYIFMSWKTENRKQQLQWQQQHQQHQQHHHHHINNNNDNNNNNNDNNNNNNNRKHWFGTVRLIFYPFCKTVISPEISWRWHWESNRRDRDSG